MKRQFFLAIVLFILLPVCAQNSSQAYSVFYQQDHLLYRAGDEMNVIDVDLEWPEYLNFSEEPVLQRYLAHQVFGLEADHFTDGYTNFLNQYGQPVSGHLNSVPDDSKFCYITCRLHIIGYDPGRFISFEISRKVDPMPNSTQNKKDTTELFTYDLVGHHILRTSDLIRTSRLSFGSGPTQLFQYLLFSSMNSPIPDDFGTSALIFESCLKKNGMFFKVGVANPDHDFLERTSEVSYKQLMPFATKGLKTLLSSKASPNNPEVGRSEAYLGSGPVYETVDSVPRYVHGQGTITQDLTKWITVTPDIVNNLVSHRILVRFIVEPSGNLSNIRVLAPGEPSFDREIVNALRQLPRWKPGIKDGKPVRTLVLIPVTIRANS
ncbi:MAG: energy transducer TonB [Prevotella sp.]|jgi:hypothetical protein|nr:energy transducer TonB [Prevotella sp.]MCH3994476.1 energy transducer TonB [Prevotella sp.]